ncbi:MFS transporter [Microbacterium sp. bgisy189]|uniref:MFS transporter n=1 Tax=Microbacterium sp. bgisy189 TaxID=3413798 RepID=UPI003EBC6672
MSQSVDAADGTNGPDGTDAAAPAPSLWRDRNFVTMWGGQALSQFGAQIVELALPVLAVLLLHATEAQVGYLNAASMAAFLVVGLPAGAWIDRMRKRHVMIWADAVRALALTAVPALHLLGILEMWHLYVVALIVGIATVFFDVSYQSLVPSLVQPKQIADANGKLESTQQLAGLTGPAIAGGLVGLISAPMAILATVGTYIASMIALLSTRDHEERRAPEDRAPLHREIAEGLRWVFGNPLLRRIVATTAISNLTSTLVFTLTPIFFLRILGFSPELMGLLFSLGAVGGLLGAIATPRLVSRFGEARLIPLSAIGFSLAMVPFPLAAILPTPAAFVMLVLQGMLMGFGVLVYNITQVTFRQRITPPRLLGRMNASIRFCVWGVMPLSALAAGWLGTWLGTVPTLWIGTVGALLSALPVVIGPFWRLRNLPDAREA